MAEMLSIMRIISYDDKDDQPLKDIQQIYKETKRVKPFNLENEQLSMNNLMDLLNMRIAIYPRTVVEDKKMLEE